MLKYILSLVTIFLFIAPFSGWAQHRRSLWINGITGLNGSLILNQNAYGNPEMAYAPTFGFTAGGQVIYFHEKKLGFSGSVLYTRTGQNYAGIQAGAYARRNVRLTYAEVPMLVMKKFIILRNPLWLAAGPDVMILLNANQKYSREGGNSLQNPEGMIEGNITERFKKADLTINASISRLFDLKWYPKTMLILAVNTAIGVTDLNNPDWQIPNSQGIYGKSHNFYLGFRIGIMFEVERFGGADW